MCSTPFWFRNHLGYKKVICRMCGHGREAHTQRRACDSTFWLDFRVDFSTEYLHTRTFKYCGMQTILFCESKESHNKSLCSKWQQAVNWKLYISKICVYCVRAQKVCILSGKWECDEHVSRSHRSQSRKEWIFFYSIIWIGSSLRVYGNPIYSSDSNWLVYTVKSNVIGPFIKPNATIGMDERKQFNYTKVNIVHVYVIAVSASVFRTGITAGTNWICVIHFDAMVYRWNLGKSIDED